MLTVTSLHIENSKNKKVKLLNNTLTFGDVLLGNITFFIFAVFDV